MVPNRLLNAASFPGHERMPRAFPSWALIVFGGFRRPPPTPLAHFGLVTLRQLYTRRGRGRFSQPLGHCRACRLHACRCNRARRHRHPATRGTVKEWRMQIQTALRLFRAPGLRASTSCAITYLHTLATRMERGQASFSRRSLRLGHQ